MKIFYFDTETTGLDHNKNAIIQLAYIVEIDGVEKEEGNILIQPGISDIVEPSALQVNGRTHDEIYKAPFLPPADAFAKIMDVLNKYIDRYDKNDKFFPAGYNVQFDCNFLSSFFTKNGNKFYGSYFEYLKLDPSSLLIFFSITSKVKLESYKLANVCKHFGIEINAHDAMSDIRATKMLAEKLKTI